MRQTVALTKLVLALVVAVLALPCLALIPLSATAERELPEYTPTQERLMGTLTSAGSETLAYLLAFWGTDFEHLYPGVKFQMRQSGSATAPPALIDGSASLGSMSRPMSPEEIKAFVKKFGYPPTEFRVALDGLAVYVNMSNPINSLTLPQLDAIYSATHKCGSSQIIATWDKAGAGPAWAGHNITLLGRDNQSGTHEFFREKALCNGDYNHSVKALASPLDIQRALAVSKNAIGYSAAGGEQIPGIKAVAIAAEPNAPFVAPTMENISTAKYPLTRFLYIYVNKAPGKPLPPLEKEFLKMVFSRMGQQRVHEEGFVSLSNDMVATEEHKF